MLTVSQTQTGRKCASVRFSGFDSCWHADQAASRRCYVSTCAGFLPVLAGAAALTWERVQEVWGVWGGCVEGRWTGIPHISKPLLWCIAFYRRDSCCAPCTYGITQVKSKYQRIDDVYATFFDAQKVHAGVPQTGMCEIRREQNALYLNHCSECQDTERALHDTSL